MQKHQLEPIIERILNVWNNNCETNGVKSVYSVTIQFREKKLKIADTDNKLHEGTVNICELCLIERTTDTGINKLLYRTESPIDRNAVPNFKGSEYELKQLNKHSAVSDVCHGFLYECIGSFCVASSKFFNDKQIADYDFDLDRIKGDEGYKGIWIEVDKADETTWYKVGDKYEVFTQTPNNNWGVYSYRQDHKNGIGQIPLIHAKLIKEERTTVKSDATVEEVAEKINEVAKEVIVKAPRKRTTKTK